MQRIHQTYDVDCLSACLASVLHLQLSEVPLFPAARQHELMQRWLYERGLTMVDVPIRPVAVSTCACPWLPIRATWCILSLQYSGVRGTHAVVGRARAGRVRIVHDPDNHKEVDRTAKGRVVSIAFLVPCDVAKWRRKADA